MMKVLVVVLGVLILVNGVECRKAKKLGRFEYSAISCRGKSASIVDFGGVGDGRTLNTKVFQKAVNELSKYASQGGALLFVPAGKWLTGPFNLTSHFTLFLHKDALLLASQVNTHMHTERERVQLPLCMKFLYSSSHPLSFIQLLYFLMHFLLSQFF